MHNFRRRTRDWSFKNKILSKETIDSKNLKTLTTLNPDYWESYYLVGKYYYNMKFYDLALNQFNIAKSKEITTLQDQREIDLYIKRTKRKLKLIYDLKY